MKLYELFILFALILCTSASSRQDSERELHKFLRSNHITEQRRGGYQHFGADSSLEGKRYVKQTGSEPTLLNVTVIHRGFYLVTVKINYLRNGTQDEFETDSFFDGTNRVIPLQKNPSDIITYVRIRFHVVGSLSLFGDFQVIDPRSRDLCFVLSGTAFTPVYSICAPDEDYTRKR
ncbi:hypothetical protein I4U23_010169 [Adineta vaga]|nr:hypothetical protein I4U23_010169 [Adineta vaga]